MSHQQDEPPTYQESVATGSSAASKPSHLEVPQARNGIPAAQRRSMEDEQRPLPEGWIRQYDTTHKHQFFVDTKADPPRSIWTHPYDDEQFLKSLPSEERERIQDEERRLREKGGLHQDLTDDESVTPPKTPQELPARPDGTDKDDKKSFGRKMKDKLTGTTHEQRQEIRANQAEQEKQYYEAHLRFREALHRAQMTGQPQFLARDQNGHDVYVEPPQYYQGRYMNGGYAYNPWQSGLYHNPNNRFIAPPGASYARPYGPARYGGGYGLPIAGGLMGGMLLGGLLF